MKFSTAGSVIGLRRYPVKSMQGEEVAEARLSERGLPGDRAYAILEKKTGHIASAKHSRKWGALLGCRAVFVEEPKPGIPLPPVWITLPDGRRFHSEQKELNQVLSDALGREVELISEAPERSIREANRAPLELQENIRKEVMGRAAPAGTFFDYAALHLLTTATLDCLQELHPAGSYDVRRFRPNLVVTPAGEARGFVENEWLGRIYRVGDRTLLKMIDPTTRCVITTLEQNGLPRDLDILRTITRNNAAASITQAPGMVLQAVVGVYASVLQGGLVRAGDEIQQEAYG